MRAIYISSLEGPGAVELVDVKEPSPRDDQVLIDVKAAGITFPDVLETRGLYQMKPSLPFIPGTEIAGVVRHDACGFRGGDRVAAFPGLGGFAETVAVDAVQVFPLPKALSFEQGAGIPMNVLTVHFALQRRGQMKPGETVLVHGAAGGIGTSAIQFAHAKGNKVIAVGSSEEKRDFAKKAGADVAIPVEGFLEAVKDLTDGKGADIVVDPVGGDRFTDSLRCLGSDGRLLVIGFTAGEIPTVRVNRLLLNNISVVGVGWGSYFMAHPELLHEQWDDLADLLEKGTLAPIIGSEYLLHEASKALQQMDERGALGKIVLKIGD